MLTIFVLIQTYYPLVTSIISVAAMLAALTPTPVDDNILSGLRKVIDFLAFNFGNAKNAPPKQEAPEVKETPLPVLSDRAVQFSIEPRDK